MDCDDYETASGNFSSNWQRLVISWFEKNVPKKTLAVTTNTYYMRDKLTKWGVPAKKIKYISFSKPSKFSKFIKRPRRPKILAIRGELTAFSYQRPSWQRAATIREAGLPQAQDARSSRA